MYVYVWVCALPARYSLLRDERLRVGGLNRSVHSGVMHWLETKRNNNKGTTAGLEWGWGVGVSGRMDVGVNAGRM